MKNHELRDENSLPKQFVEKNKGMFLFDFQTVNFRGSKKAPSIADIRSFGLASLLILVALKSEIRRRTSKQLCLLKISGYCHSRKAEE